MFSFLRVSELSYLNPHLHERVSEHRDQKYFGEVSFWPAEYRNRPPIVPFIFNFQNFGVFWKFLIRPEMHYLDAIFCLMHLKQYWNKIKLLINIYLLSGGNRHWKRRFRAKIFFLGHLVVSKWVSKTLIFSTNFVFEHNQLNFLVSLWQGSYSHKNLLFSEK
jgi:hypothetical protein